MLKIMVQPELDCNKGKDFIGNYCTLQNDTFPQVSVWKIVPDPLANRQAKNGVSCPLQPFIGRHTRIAATGMRKGLCEKIAVSDGCVTSCSTYKRMPKLNVSRYRFNRIRYRSFLPWYSQFKLIAHSQSSIVAKLNINQSKDRFHHVGVNLGAIRLSRSQTCAQI